MKTDAISAARELAPLLVRLRDETETGRRPPAPIVERLRDTRLCRLAVAAALDGFEMPHYDALEVYEALAYAEASVAWIVWNNSLPCMLARFLAPGARAEVFAEPRWLYACSTRPTGRIAVADAGFRVDGRWGIVSGCELAEWILLLGVVTENGEPRMLAPGNPEMRFAFVRRGEYEIVDTWRVGGLRGTGSHDVVVKNVRVSRSLTLTPADPSTLDSPLGRVPIICSMAAAYAAQALGVAQSALDAVIELTSTKVSPDGGQALRDAAHVLSEIARHATSLDAARAHVHACAARLWQTAVAGGPPAIDEITAVWGASLNAADAAQRALEAMYAAGGTSSLYTASPLERAHRDMHAMRRHIVCQPFWLEDAGRVKLGGAPKHPLYAV
jgi:alkylation response protein AidB-like acyl-CoA dehydrogenase